MLPTREEALKLICDGLLFNPGPWGKHCLTAAHCAEKIASWSIMCRTARNGRNTLMASMDWI